MLSTKVSKSLHNVIFATLAFLLIYEQLVFAEEIYDPLDRLNAGQSQQFAPAYYLEAQQSTNEELVEQKDFIEAFIQKQGSVAEKRGAPVSNSMGLKLVGPKKAPLATSQAPMPAAEASVSVMADQELAQEILPESDIILNEFQINSNVPYSESWLIDCGASAPYTDPTGSVWAEDEDFYSLFRWGYAGGSSAIASTADPITGTDLPAIYQTYRYGNSPYKIDMPNGEYRVTLMFAETFFEEAGRRVFDVALEGNTLWHNVDIYAWANGHDTAMNLAADVSVNDYCLDLTFPVAYMDLPMISGIKVEAVNVSDDEFLDFIQRKMFWFYLTETNTTTGLVKWGENNWAPGYGNISSVASNGMALSAYTFGVERGWMTEADAYTRTSRMLDSFDSLLENIHGFWYHYVYMDSGARADYSEISTVDSAIFIMGAIQSGEYFKDTHPDIAAKANTLYERMDWTWFTGISLTDPFQERFVNMGWKPENDGYSYIIPSGREEGGFFCNNWWNRYCESVFVDLLALGSPTHPIDYSAWYDMYRGWVDAFGYDFIQYPSLFVHQYQQLYFNFVDKRDIFADYFLNTQLATLANRQTCAEDPRYGQDIWGLTACAGPDGYYAYGGYPGGYHDGTVAPTAPGGSIIFTPEESIASLRRMYFQYKDFIWGLHGFCDSFNAGQDFRDWAANALDNGSMILGIENFRSGLIMDTFMQNQYMQNALNIAGFYDNGPIAASSEENPGLASDFAFDGNPATRWSSRNYDTPQWLEYDFGSTATFDTITIDWEAAYAKTYKIQVSDNRINWADVYETTEGNGGIDEIIFSPIEARYVRLYATERGTEWAYSVWEMKIENNGYYTIHLPEVSWSGVSGLYESTGAAVCQMLLNFIRDGAGASLLGQDEIYEYARGSGPYDGSELVPDEIDRALGHYDPYDAVISGWADTYDSRPDGNPYQGYNYSIDTFNPATDPGAINNYLRDICHWIAYPVTQGEWWHGGDLAARPFSPSVVPLYGGYEHWVVVTGFIASENPCPDPSNPFYTPDFDIHGFWVYDPSAGGIGQDVYISASDLASLYLMPLDTGDAYDGLLLHISEPPTAAR